MGEGADRPRGKWERLAEALGFVPVYRRRWIGSRIRMLVGDREGYLAAIWPTNTLSRTSVDVLVRFPQAHTVRGFREDLLGHPAFVAGFGRRRRLPRRRCRNVYVADGSVLVRLPYEVIPPSRRRIELVLDGLVTAMRDHVRTLDRLCEMCARPDALGIYLADGIPAILCEPCVASYQHRESEIVRQIREREPELPSGIGLGAGAAVAFGIAAGALAAPAPALLGPAGVYVTSPAFFLIGYLVAAFASRDFVGSGVASTLVKFPIAVFGGLVGWTVMNAVARQVVDPAIWNLTLLAHSVWRPGVSSARHAIVIGSVALAGALTESVVGAIGRRRVTRLTALERVDRDAATGSTASPPQP